jgi:hypothetical protein
MGKFVWLALASLCGCAAVQVNAGGQSSGVLKSNGTTFGYTDAQFERIAQQIDNPDQIFKAAGYTPLWTASKEEAAGRLPKGLTVTPKEARVWEPWFRKQITHNGKQLTTADILKMKWAVIQTVATDPGAQFKPGQSDQSVFEGVEAARIKGLKLVGLDDSNPIIFQMSRADAVLARCKSQRSYAPSREVSPELKAIEDGRPPRYPSLSELNKQDYPINCVRSNLEFIRILRGVEKLGPSGLSVGSMYVFRYDLEGQRLSHGQNGVKVKCPDGKVAHLYYDPTAARGAFSNMNLSIVAKDAGLVDQASFESFANRHCISVMGPQLKGWEQDGKDIVGFEYILGENWPEFGIGNFDLNSSGPSKGFHYTDRKLGTATFEKYHAANLPKIVSLSKAVDQVFTGK